MQVIPLLVTALQNGRIDGGPERLLLQGLQQCVHEFCDMPMRRVMGSVGDRHPAQRRGAVAVTLKQSVQCVHFAADDALLRCIDRSQLQLQFRPPVEQRLRHLRRQVDQQHAAAAFFTTVGRIEGADRTHALLNAQYTGAHSRSNLTKTLCDNQCRSHACVVQQLVEHDRRGIQG